MTRFTLKRYGKVALEFLIYFAITFVVFFVVTLLLGKSVAGTENTSSATLFKIEIDEVLDGDTVAYHKAVGKILIRTRIRLYGIDAPESTQPFGKESAIHLSNLVQNKTCYLQIIDIDQYGRELGILYVDAQDINDQMVLSGYAYAYPFTRPVSNNLKFHEQFAKANKLGVWSSNKALQLPWEYRKEKNKRVK